MTRPTILDLDLVVVPSKADVGMLGAWYRYKSGHRFAGEDPARDTSDVGAYTAMLSASPYPTAWDDVRKYVEGLEAGHKAVSDFVRVRIPDDQNKDQADCYLAHIGLICRLEERAEAAEARIAELEAERDAAIGSAERQWAGWVKSEVESKQRIAELEKRLADAERVIEPFSKVAGEIFARNWQDKQVVISLDNPDASHRVTFSDFRAARAYMEGK